MSKTTSVTIDGHFETFINERMASGQFASANDVVHVALERYEDDVRRKKKLDDDLREGVESGFVEFDPVKNLEELHKKYLSK